MATVPGFFKNTYFVVTGALSLVALLFPDLIVLGMFMLVLPGLILGFAPNFFLYPLGVRTIYRRLPGLPGVVRPATAVLALIIPAVALPWSFNRPTWTYVAALRSDDVAVSGPVQLPRTIALLKNRRAVRDGATKPPAATVSASACSTTPPSTR